jgi:hypothetical protein
VFGSKKTKGLKQDRENQQGHLCPRNDSLSFNNNYITKMNLGTVKFNDRKMLLQIIFFRLYVKIIKKS